MAIFFKILIYLLVIEQVRPTLIIVSTKTQNSLMEKIEEYRQLSLFEGINGALLTLEVGDENKCELLLLPSRSCSPKAASIQLASVRVSDSSVTLSVCRAEEQSAHESRNGSAIEDANWRDDEGAGMGTYRLSLVKLGCWMNINAPLAVSEVLHPCSVVPTKL